MLSEPCETRCSVFGAYVDLGDGVGSGSGSRNISLSLLWGCFQSPIVLLSFFSRKTKFVLCDKPISSPSLKPLLVFVAPERRQPGRVDFHAFHLEVSTLSSAHFLTPSKITLCGTPSIGRQPVSPVRHSFTLNWGQAWLSSSVYPLCFHQLH